LTEIFHFVSAKFWVKRRGGRIITIFGLRVWKLYLIRLQFD